MTKKQRQIEKFTSELATASESLEKATTESRLGDAAYWEGVTDSLRWVIQELR